MRPAMQTTTTTTAATAPTAPSAAWAERAAPAAMRAKALTPSLAERAAAAPFALGVRDTRRAAPLASTRARIAPIALLLAAPPESWAAPAGVRPETPGSSRRSLPREARPFRAVARDDSVGRGSLPLETAPLPAARQPSSRDSRTSLRLASIAALLPREMARLETPAAAFSAWVAAHASGWSLFSCDDSALCRRRVLISVRRAASAVRLVLGAAFRRHDSLLLIVRIATLPLTPSRARSLARLRCHEPI